jgi:hypothetical protein
MKSAGTAKPSFTASLVEEASYRADSPPDEEDIICGAGSDTVHVMYSHLTVTYIHQPYFLKTVSALHTFMLAMVLYPDVQVKAQAELDNVLGPDRLPEFEDRENLPYINAICLETLRW